MYDADLDVTWIADFNLFGSMAKANPSFIAEIVSRSPTVKSAVGGYSSFGIGGSTGTYSVTEADFLVRDGSSSLMTWFGAQAWAAQLSYQGLGGWRVAGSFLWEDGAFSNELYHLWTYDLGITGADPGGRAGTIAMFTGQVNFGGGYWLGSELDAIGQNGYVSSAAIYPNAIGASTALNRWNVMLVRDGDVDRQIPEPASLMLVLLGLLCVSATRLWARLPA